MQTLIINVTAQPGVNWVFFYFCARSVPCVYPQYTQGTLRAAKIKNTQFPPLTAQLLQIDGGF
jgi:hypothetical protein